ncbi:MAG: putative transcriptional regulator [Pseudobdellovibrio sp.]|nr:putative transcriptional regulator [Pseudobdellovibrio sp.]
MYIIETGVSIVETPGKNGLKRPMDIEDIKIKEIKVFMELLKTGSVRAVARQRDDHAGQISKIIVGLEKKVGFKLIERSNFGIQPTARALELLPLFDDIQKSEEDIRSSFTTKEKDILSFAANFFLASHLLPQVFSAFEKPFPTQRLRLLDLPPSSFLQVALRNGFQICLHTGDHEWPKTWSSTKVGDIHWILCAGKKHPVLEKTTLKEVLKYPFIFPVYWTDQGIVYGKDNFPQIGHQRIRGHETATAVSALEIIRRTEQLGFVPEIVARPFLKTGEVVQIELSAVKTVKQPVYLSVKNDRISQKMYKWLIETCEKELSL